MQVKEKKTVTYKANGVNLVSSLDIPELASAREGTTVTCPIVSKKTIWKFKRIAQRELLGSNNKRKRHGLPMYRKWA